MTDRVLAAISVLALALFCSVVVIYVKEIDLTLIIVVCIILAIHDFWATFRDQAKENDGSN